MISHKVVRLLLLAVLAFVALAQIYRLRRGILQLADEWFWFTLLLAFLGMMSLLLRPNSNAVPILALLLASLAFLFSEAPSDNLSFLWIAAKGLFGFVFIHFSLVFPLRSDWFGRNRYRVALIYLPYALWLVMVRWEILGGLLEVLVIPLGFLVGVGIFIRNYRFSLTPAEKNRLRLVLIGCLAGALPEILANLGPLPLFAQYISHFFLFPLFPICLVFAVLTPNLAEVSPAFQKALVYCMVAAGLVAGLFVSSLLIAWCFSDTNVGSGGGTVVTLVVPLALVYPLWKWASTYVTTRFLSFPVVGGAQRDTSLQFQPIRPNPFIVGNPVRDPEMFFGRREDFGFIRSKIRNQRQGSIIVLTGERRTGKSSILYQILNGSLGDEHVPVLLDMQGLVVENDLEFLEALASEIYKVVPANQENQYETLRQGKTPHIAFTSFIDSAAEQIGDRHLLLLFDEYELIEDKIKAGKLSPEIPNYLNSVLERQPRLGLIFTGSRPFEANQLWNALLGKSVYREISFLNRNDAEDLILSPLEGRVLLRRDIVGRSLRLTNGHPFYTQLLGQTMVDVVNERANPLVDRTVLREVIRRVIEHPPPQLLYLWSELSTSEKLLLSGLATLLRTGQDYASSRRVSDVLESLPQEHRHTVDLVETRVLMESLRQRRLLDRDQTRYRFTMDLIRRWVYTERSVWNVLGEAQFKA